MPLATRRVSFYAGPGWERWSPTTIEQDGAGGSETALVRLATALVGRGWSVTVYSDVFEGVVGGVSYRSFDSWQPDEPVDAFVSSRLPAVFDARIAAATRALWCHDANYAEELTTERAENVTDVLALSEWHRDHLAERYPFVRGKLSVVRNGVALRSSASGEDLFPSARRAFDDRLPHCIYSSSPARGLDVLLELWPEIRRHAPDAELHVYYGWEVYDRIAVTRPPMRAFKVLLFHLLEQAGGEAGGVFMHGRVSQPALHFAMQNGRVWSYPTAFYETSCIGAMEARAAGLPIVTSALGALRETVGEHGTLIPFEREPAPDEPSGNRWPAYRAAFTETVVRLLTDGRLWTEQHERALAGVAELDWNLRAPNWEKVLTRFTPHRLDAHG